MNNNFLYAVAIKGSTPYAVVAAAGTQYRHIVDYIVISLHDTFVNARGAAGKGDVIMEVSPSAYIGQSVNHCSC